MKVVFFFALSLVVCTFGCSEPEAGKNFPQNKTVGAAKDSPTPTPTPTPTNAKTSEPPVPLEKTAIVRPSGGKPHPYTIRPGCAAFSPDGKQVLIGFGHGMFGPRKPPGWSVQLFEVETGKHLRTLNGHQGDVRFVAFFPDGKTAISAGDDGWFRVWDVDKGVEVRRFPGKVHDAVMLRDGKRLLCSFRRLQLWDAVEGKLLEEYNEFSNPVSSITVSPDGNRALFGGIPSVEDGIEDLTLLRLWDVEKGKVLRAFDPKKDRLGRPCAFSEDSKFAVSFREDEKAKKLNGVLWEVSSGKEINEFPVSVFAPQTLYLSLKENRIVIVGWQGDLVCLDAKSGKELWATKAPGIGVFAFSANGKRALSAGGVMNHPVYRGIILWDLETGKELRRLTPNFDEPQAPLPANDP